MKYKVVLQFTSKRVYDNNERRPLYFQLLRYHTTTASWNDS